jgi:hypothetical protein
MHFFSLIFIHAKIVEATVGALWGETLPGVSKQKPDATQLIKNRIAGKPSRNPGLFVQIELNGNLPPDFNHRIRGQPEIFAQMRGVALHHYKTRRHPFRQTFAVVAGENGLVTNIIGDVRKIDATAAGMGLPD